MTRQRPKSHAAPSWKTTWRQRWLGIQNRIIFPYLTITVLVAAIGTYIVTNLVAGSLQERLSNQLLESGRVTSDGMVRFEQAHLETLRLMALASGTDTAIKNANLEFLRVLIESLGDNAQIPDAVVMDSEGKILIGRGSFANSSFPYSRMVGVQAALAHQTDERGDKFSGISFGISPPVLYVAGPVVSSSDPTTLQGVIVVGTPLKETLASIKREALADIVIYDLNGQVIDSTFAFTIDSLEDMPSQEVKDHLDQADTETTEIEVNERSYQGIYAPLQMRGETIGLMAVFLPSDFIVSEGGTSARIFSALFGVAAFLIIFLGLLVARTIVSPVQKLVSLAQDVTQGDLTRRSRLQSQDEIGYLGFTFDIMTQRLEQRTRQLEAEAARLKSILANSQTGMIMVNPKGKVAFMNQSAMRFFDVTFHSKDEITRKVHSLLKLAPRDKIEFNDYILSTVTTKVTNAQTGELLGTLIALNDITQEELTKQLKDRFITQVSHELRTPLTAITGYGDLIETTVELGKTPKQDHLTGLLEQAKLLDKMISELLSISQMSAGTFFIRRQKIDLRPVLLQAIEAEQQRIQEADLTLQKFLYSNPCLIKGDEASLRWAFHHILDNAIKYNLPGGKIICELSPALNGNHHIVISDTGVGIRSVDQRYVFDAYYRREAETPTGEVIDPRGMGLGLYIVQNIVEAHQGSVTLESTWSKGTTLILTFPSEN